MRAQENSAYGAQLATVAAWLQRVGAQPLAHCQKITHNVRNMSTSHTLYVDQEKAETLRGLPSEWPERPRGHAGTRDGGVEHLAEWRGNYRRAATINRMLLTSPTVAGLVDSATQAVCSAHYHVREDEHTDEAAAEGLRRWLGLGKHRGHSLSGMSWVDLLSHMHSAVIFGHAALSFAPPPDSVKAHGLHFPRFRRLRQSTYESFTVTRDDEQLAALTQRAGLGRARVTIPAGELLWLVHRADLGGDIDGLSVLRPVFAHWRSSQEAYAQEDVARARYAVPPLSAKLDAEAFSRFGSGESGAPPTKEDFEAEIKSIEATLRALRSKSGEHVVLPSWVDVKMLTPNADFEPAPLLNSAGMHERRMAERFGESYRMQGRAGENGSRAMVQTQAEASRPAVAAKIEWMLGEFNRQAVATFIKINWPGLPRERWPAVDYERASVIPPKWLNNPAVVSGLIASGVITPFEGDEHAVRRMLELPEPPGDLPDALDRQAGRAGGRGRTRRGQAERRSPSGSKRAKNPHVSRLVPDDEEQEADA